MNKILAYILLILIFLGLSKNFSPQESNFTFIKDEKVLANYFRGAPLTLILVQSFESGLFIKTYYHKYRVIQGFQKPTYVLVRTSKDFWRQNLGNLGMALFSRDEKHLQETIVPLPPGLIYLNNLAYGNWVPDVSGVETWQFHTAYTDENGLNFPLFFGWYDFRPNKSFFRIAEIHQREGRPFYGPQKEFGSEGKLIQKWKIDNTQNTMGLPKNFSWPQYFRQFITLKSPQEVRD